jgi:subtilisin family serine protease
MSLGGGASTLLDNAVVNAINAGVTAVVAAGNDNADACNYSPARVTAAITVGSTASNDARSSFSNYGTCVDIFAPGTSIYSSWHTTDSTYNTISGTSMACPHVAGGAAIFLETASNTSPAAIKSAMLSAATSNAITNPGTGSPNLLLFAGC